MRKIKHLLALLAIFVSAAACSSGSSYYEAPDIDNVDESLDGVIGKMSGRYSATWAETANDVTYVMTYTPYEAPKYMTVRVSNGSSVNFTKKIRVFGRVNVVKKYIYANGSTSNQSDDNYLYGIESTVGEPYQLVYYTFSASAGEDVIYGLPLSCYVKNVTSQEFYLSMMGKEGPFHLFRK